MTHRMTIRMIEPGQGLIGLGLTDEQIAATTDAPG
jgi:hypothetical protein